MDCVSTLSTGSTSKMGSSVAFSSLSTYVVHIKQSDRSSVVFTLNPLKNDKTHFAHYVVSRWAAVATYFFLMIFCHTGNWQDNK